MKLSVLNTLSTASKIAKHERRALTKEVVIYMASVYGKEIEKKRKKEIIYLL